MDKLKPCPFCGARETDTNKAGWRMVYMIESRYGCFEVYCRKCGATGALKDSMRAAKMAWNRRASDA